MDMIAAQQPSLQLDRVGTVPGASPRPLLTAGPRNSLHEGSPPTSLTLQTPDDLLTQPSNEGPSLSALQVKKPCDIQTLAQVGFELTNWLSRSKTHGDLLTQPPQGWDDMCATKAMLSIELLPYCFFFRVTRTKYEETNTLIS